MRLDFKRIMSSVLAFVMLFSSLVMVNVVSVSAATQTWTVSKSSDTSDRPSGWLTFDDVGSNKFSKKNLTDAKYIGGFADEIFTDSDGQPTGLVKNQFGWVTANKSNTITVDAGTSKTAKLTIYAMRDDANAISLMQAAPVAGNESATIELNSASVPAANGVEGMKSSDSTTPTVKQAPLIYDIKGGGKFTINSKDNKGLTIFKVILVTEDEGSPTPSAEYNWQFKADGVTLGGETFQSDKLKFAVDTSSDKRNAMRYDGNEFMINPKYTYLNAEDSSQSYISVDEAQHTITVTISNDMLLERKAVDIKIYNAGINTSTKGRILRIQCDDNEHRNILDPIRLSNVKGEDSPSVPVNDIVVNPVTGEVEETRAISDGKVWLAKNCNYTLTMIGGQLATKDSTDENITLKNTLQPSSENTYEAKFIPDTRAAATTAMGDVGLLEGLEVMGETENMYSGAVISKDNVFEVWQDANENTVTMVRDDTNPLEGKIKAISLRTTDEKENGGLIFETAEKVKMTISYEAQEEGKAANLGIKKFAADNPTGEDLAAEEKNDSTTSKDFTITLDAGTYLLYNDGNEKESGTVGPTRLTAVKFEKPDGSVVTPAKEVYLHFAGRNDPEKNPPAESTDATVFDTSIPTDGGSEFSNSGYSVEIAGKTYTLYQHKSIDRSSSYNITVPAEVTDADLYIVGKSGGSDERTVTLTKDTEVKTASGFGSTATYKIINKLSAGTYKMTFNGGFHLSMLALVVNSKGPAVATISGNVSLTKKFEYVDHDNTKFDDNNGGHPVNVKFGDGSDTSKTINTINKLTVSVKGPGDSDITDITYGADKKTYTIGSNTEGGLKAGQYTITIDADGVKKTEKVTIPEEPTAQTVSSKLTAPQYTVKFVTNIKNFTDNSKEVPHITLNGEDIFTLEDVTYYNTGTVVGVEGMEDGTVNSAESTTHTVKMPAGNYAYTYDGTDYKLSLSSADETGGGSLNFTISRNSTQNIYFIPQTEDVTAVNDVAAVKGTLSGAVDRGKYTFSGNPASINNAEAVTVTYQKDSTSGTLTGNDHGMAAYFMQGHQGGSGHAGDATYLGLNRDHGAIVFTLNKPLLAKIETGFKACVLYNVDSSPNTINGTHSSIPIDSSFSKRTVSLMPGTYAIISLAQAGSGPNGEDGDKTEAKVDSIEFLAGSPFVVEAENIIKPTNIAEAGNNAMMVVGSCNAADDNLTGTTSAASYDTFAILIANTKEALGVDAIDGILEYEDYNVGEKDETVSVTEESDGYSTEDAYVYNMTVNDGKLVIRDETKFVFTYIKDDNGDDIITDESGNTKYYATIVNGLQSDKTYWAAGAAMVKGAEENTWLVQDEPVSFKLSE